MPAGCAAHLTRHCLRRNASPLRRVLFTPGSSSTISSTPFWIAFAPTISVSSVRSWATLKGSDERWMDVSELPAELESLLNSSTCQLWGEHELTHRNAPLLHVSTPPRTWQTDRRWRTVCPHLSDDSEEGGGPVVWRGARGEKVRGW